MNSQRANFMHFNHAGQWPGFDQRLRLEQADDGALTLATLPKLKGPLPESMESLAEPEIPQGIAVAPDGNVYFVDSQGDQIRLVDSCSGNVCPGFGGHGTELGQFDTPCDIAWHPVRRALVIADRDNHRLQLISPHGFQPLDQWPCLDAASGDAADQRARFRPASIDIDSIGNTYVVDGDSGAIIVFDAYGIPRHHYDMIGAAREVSVRDSDQGAELCVLEERTYGRWFIVVLDSGGELMHKRQIELSGVASPMGLLSAGQSAYVGDNESRSLLRFDVSDDSKIIDRFIGASPDFEGPVAGLAIAPGDSDSLWLHPGGSGAAPLELSIDGGYVDIGIAWAGPFSAADHRVQWQRLSALGITSGKQIRVALYAYTSDQQRSAPPSPIAQRGRFVTGSEADPWRSFPAGIDDIYVYRESKHIWLGMELAGDGFQTPRLEQLRLEYDRPSLTQHLPEIFRTQTHPRETLERFVSLFESFYRDLEGDIDEVARLIDGELAASEQIPEQYRQWLKEWLAVELEEEWTSEQKRAAITDAFCLNGWRGTAAGLREALWRTAGVRSHIIEPLPLMTWWKLPGAKEPGGDEPGGDVSSADSSQPDGEYDGGEHDGGPRLGLETRLIGSEPQGAVVGSSALLDQSQLIFGEDFGTPLFDDTAHRFTVFVYRDEVPDRQKLDQLRRVIDREKPAHAAYEICIIEPRVRVGVQSVIGIDTVLGGASPEPTPLGEAPAEKTVLSGRPSRIGPDSRIGDILI